MNYRKYNARGIRQAFNYFSLSAELIFSRYLNRTADHWTLIELDRELTDQLMQCWYEQFPWDVSERDFRIKVTNNFGETTCELPEWFQLEHKEALK